ncbi:MAG: flagellar biosynthesis protein FlhB [Proteobacteria bacterium]|nr:flagellar biosynthesis protein FlhB [Pseudomonadota bacterium]
MAEGQDAEDKTEEASERRIEQAREKGDVPRSVELGGFLTLAAGMAAASLAFAVIGTGAAMRLSGWLSHAHEGIEGRGQVLTLSVAAQFTEVLAGPFLAIIIAGIAANLVLNKPRIALDPLLPKFSRISPLSGFKRIFGVENLVQFGKTLLKLGLVAGVLWLQLKPGGALFAAIGGMVDARAAAGPVLALAGRVVAGVLALYAVIALMDAGWQWFNWKKKLRMSLQEVKEEHKESEGNPEIKGRIRQIRNQRARQRMMAAVPKATVVIANPTHYAVALRYDKGMAAPVCVAKGLDEVALAIRKVAEENNVPVVENIPLARALHATAEIDREIPVEHYKAVAEIIGFVFRLARRGR